MKTSKYVGFVVVLMVTLAAALAQAGWKASELFVFYPNKTGPGDLLIKGDFASALYNTLPATSERRARGGKKALGDLVVLSERVGSEYSCSEGQEPGGFTWECTLKAEVVDGQVVVTGQAAEVFFNKMSDVEGAQRAGDGFTCSAEKCQIKVDSIAAQ